MRASILAALLAACLAHVAIAVSAAPRRSLTVIDPFSSSDPLQDPGMCWESILALCSCKHNLLESILTGCPVPRPCCEAADEVDIFCDLFTSGLVGALIPRSVRKQCDATLRVHPAPRAPLPPRSPAATVSGGARAPPAPEEYTSVHPPPRAATVSGGSARAPLAPEASAGVGFPPPHATRVSGGGARAPSAPEAHTSVSSPPPRATRVFGGGARAPPTPEAHTSVSIPPPRATRASGGTTAPPPPDVITGFYLPPPIPQSEEYHGARAASPPPPVPKVATSTGSTHAPVVAGPPEPAVRGAPAAPAHGGASAGDIVAPKSKGATAPPRNARPASPSSDSLGYGTPP